MKPTESRLLRPSGSVISKILFGVASPHAQEQVHGDDGHFIEEIEKEEIQRHEDADRRGGEDQAARYRILLSGL